MSKSKINYDMKIRTNAAEGMSFKSKKNNFTAKSYRFTNEDLILLEELKRRLDDEASIKITHTKVLQILIHHCKSIQTNRLLATLKDMI